MNESELDLLRKFVEDHSEDAFASVVRQQLDFVYSAALRQVRSPDLAAEVCQSVFSDLAREATRLKPDTVLSAWLYQVTRRTAIDLVRRESRRQARERLSAEITAMNATSSDWSAIEPLLEEAMDSLDDTDRTAVLLRFFQNKSLREVGVSLGTSDDAAQKRVSRAVERLREFFDKRGVAVGSGALAALVAANSVQAAPAGLALAVSTAAGGALVATATHTAIISTLTKAVTMTTLQKAAIGTVLAVSVGFGVFEADQAATHRAQEASLRQAREEVSALLDRLNSERVIHTNQLAAYRNQLSTSGASNDELLQLRAEVTLLRQQLQSSTTSTNSSNLTEDAMIAWLARVNSLRSQLDKNPASGIPEISLLTENDWLDAARDPMETDSDYLKALSHLRTNAERKFTTNLSSAIREFAKVNNNRFPMNFAELQPFLSGQIDPAILARWEIVPGETVPNVGVGEWIITQRAPVDSNLDPRFVIGDSGSYGSTSFSTSPFETLAPAISAFFAATGKAPSDPSELLPYLTTEDQKSELQKQAQVINQLKPDERATLQKHIQQMLQFSNAPSPR